MTGRAAILLLVVAVLGVSYASSMRAYLEQRAHIVDLKEQIAERQAAIADLEREKDRWEDPAYVEAQARERFGYVMPGETAYVVLDEDGEPLEAESQLNDPADVLGDEPEAWWEDAWASVELAGDPPRDQAPPATQIDGSDEGEPEDQ
ncbi:FtsB family cell division protein [Nocardioides ferulae]|uniref:FtsB family cell division protein n=1 Tax=Nocardioides ferulae TaxID=2340821 RepID=UPI001F0B8944|nr:septum formation initiator family protein [Nocardioides ferulae]